MQKPIVIDRKSSASDRGLSTFGMTAVRQSLGPISRRRDTLTPSEPDAEPRFISLRCSLTSQYIQYCLSERASERRGRGPPDAFMECGLWEATELMERNGFLQMLQCNVRCRECFVQCDFNQEKTHSVALQTIPHLTTVQERCCPNTSVLPLYCIHKTASR
ncbi:4-hydroxy-3-methylbut-2-en-1-yl diphosphate synthase (flavodoxin) [Trichinella spiralis]|uniref:4-hydroxy-3-methylbut-2-en-1-yl diphosphate synthase (Flavodoxin) n=1 Tax=Trichinella spiralis TaxID=6334 RepID=A0ABR3KLT5_TRISP